MSPTQTAAHPHNPDPVAAMRKFGASPAGVAVRLTASRRAIKRTLRVEKIKTSGLSWLQLRVRCALRSSMSAASENRAVIRHAAQGSRYAACWPPLRCVPSPRRVLAAARCNPRWPKNKNTSRAAALVRARAQASRFACLSRWFIAVWAALRRARPASSHRPQPVAPVGQTGRAGPRAIAHRRKINTDEPWGRRPHTPRGGGRKGLRTSTARSTAHRDRSGKSSRKSHRAGFTSRSGVTAKHFESGAVRNALRFASTAAAGRNQKKNRVRNPAERFLEHT